MKDTPWREDASVSTRERARRYAALDRLAARQHGLVTAPQLEDLGFDRHRRKYLMRSGRLIVMRPGVYRLCGVAPTWQAMALAAVLAVGEGAVLSHRSAGVGWGLIDRHDVDRLELTAPRQYRGSGVDVHRHVLDPGEVTRRDGIPITTIERTLVDLATTADARTVGRWLDLAQRRGLTTPARLARRAAAARGSGRRRIRPVLKALEVRGANHEPGANDWERLMDRLWEQMELPPAHRQFKVRVMGRTYRLDRAIPERRLAVEWVGRSDHGTRSGFEYDAERRARLGAADWVVLEFTPGVSAGFIRATVMAAYDGRADLEKALEKTPAEAEPPTPSASLAPS